MARQVLAGGVRAVARVITWIENQEPVGAVVLKRLTPPEKRAMVIGITGYPGTGKSTLIDQLIAAYRRLGKTVGVLAVDISSPLTGGAVLGEVSSKKWTPSTYNKRAGGVRWNRSRDSSIRRSSGSRPCGWSWNSR
jgi:pantothenate kinase